MFSSEEFRELSEIWNEIEYDEHVKYQRPLKSVHVFLILIFAILLFDQWSS